MPKVKIISFVIYSLSILVAFPINAVAAMLTPDLITLVKATTLEVVMPKPGEAGVTYDQKINYELLPYSYRTDKYLAIGTAFILPDGDVVTAAHVLSLEDKKPYGFPMVRDINGKVYEIDKIIKYSYERDFVKFTLKNYKPENHMTVAKEKVIGSTVFAVGNALGEGIIFRDGVYTSNTLEEQEGKWKWLRFSAATSPGNSGGPLLDAEGHVLGLIVRKSPNENLNYALPIEEILEAPNNLAVVHVESTYKLPIMEYSYTGIIDNKWVLPLSASELSEKLQKTFNRFNDASLVSLLDNFHNEIFPEGSGSRKILYTSVGKSNLSLIMHNQDGEWVPNPANSVHFDLGANGALNVGQIESELFMMNLKRPDDLDAQSIQTDSKKFMDTLLKGFKINRNVGAETARITSLGNAQQSSSIQDKYGRIWNVQIWDIPYDYTKLIVYRSPVPDGYMILLSRCSANTCVDMNRDMNALTNFTIFSYFGTIVDWKIFLANSALKPKFLQNIRFESNAGQLKIETEGFWVECGIDCISLNEQSIIGLGMAFEKTDTGASLKVHTLDILDSLASNTSLMLTKVMHPPVNLGVIFTDQWTKASGGLPPFNGVPILDGDNIMIAKKINKRGSPNNANSDAEQVSQLVAVYKEKGQQDKDKVKGKFKNITKNIIALP